MNLKQTYKLFKMKTWSINYYNNLREISITLYHRSIFWLDCEYEKFTINNIQLISKLVNANFPDYETVIPGNNNLIVKCNTKAFAETIDRVSTISSEKFRTVKLQIQNNKCIVSSFGEEKSAGTEEIDVIYDGKDININFNARYILEVLSIITSEKIKICFADSTAPTMLKGDTEDNNSLYLIMQMRA